MYTFPDDSKLTKTDLVDKAKTTVVKTKTCNITGVCACVINVYCASVYYIKYIHIK